MIQLKYLLLGILLMPLMVSSQKREEDSLSAVLKTTKNDTNKVNALNMLSSVYRGMGKYDTSLVLADAAKILAEKINYKKGIAEAYHTIGIIYRNQGNYPLALESDFKALNTYKEIGDKQGAAIQLGNIGVVYWNQDDTGKALEYYFKALELNKTIHNKRGIALNYGNIGLLYINAKNYSKAQQYELKALNLNEEIQDKTGVAMCLNNLGSLYGSDTLHGGYTLALQYYFKSLALCKELGIINTIGNNYRNIGNIYVDEKKFNLAKKMVDSAIYYSEKSGTVGDLINEYTIRSTIDTVDGNFRDGMKDFMKRVRYENILTTQINSKKAVQAEMNNEFKQKQLEQKAAQDQKDALTALDEKKQKTITFFVSLGLILVLIFSGTLYSRVRLIQRQKRLIEKQKLVVEEKNKEVLDSITYAKRLQDAILPPISIIKKYLPESFFLYKPKDIVAGDFYWMERSGDNILLAACDCTGHGVPGAMVSVVCSNALNRTVKEFHIAEPGKILDKVRELVLETFEKSESEVQDGMDISLCCLNTQTKEIQWSGANNSLWYIQNNELKEVAPDKQPIGKQENPKPFNTHSLKLQKGDTLYLYTDGYADQFGGAKGKKFKYKQLQEKLLAMTSLNMDLQKEMLDETIESWKGNLEQVDDILIIGIRV